MTRIDMQIYAYSLLTPNMEDDVIVELTVHTIFAWVILAVQLFPSDDLSCMISVECQWFLAVSLPLVLQSPLRPYCNIWPLLCKTLFLFWLVMLNRIWIGLHFLFLTLKKRVKKKKKKKAAQLFYFFQTKFQFYSKPI